MILKVCGFNTSVCASLSCVMSRLQGKLQKLSLAAELTISTGGINNC